ncbi:phage virion morphogenesis protein [uncultured Tateyamaria sp.]|uniref:phage virion morphogenesis protein n=1 Tax=uncultured Tateyamaria sp. TaxID=455651 RepID=UPI002616798C|nr:phage virion morphogenesis protein [uncultured Tateyamaria sp.]
MSSVIRTDIQNDTVSTALARADDALDDLTPLMEQLGQLMVVQTKKNFDAGTAPDGTPWAPKSETTKEAYRRRQAKGSVAVVSDRPLIGPNKMLSTQITFEATSDTMDWGSNMVYAAVMQLGAAKGAFGTKSGIDKNGRAFAMAIPWGHIPARPYLGIGPDDEMAILRAIELWLTATTDAP